MFVGSACKTKKEEAIIKAIEELAQGFSWVHLMKKYKNYNFGKNFENITHFEHHALLYATLSDLSVLDFVIKTNRAIDYKDMKEVDKKDSIYDMVRNNKFDIVEIDLTTPDVAQIGYHVKKIMIPGLQPLNSNHNLNFLDRKRINKAIIYLERRKIQFSNQLNLFPHPFP